MEAFSDDEFYEARDEISSNSGSDESSDEDDATADISGRQEQQQQQQERSSSRWQDRSSKPPRHNQIPQWLAESRFSVWQDGPKSIQERRRLLYERFGILGRKGEGSDNEDNGTAARPTARDAYNGTTQIRATRFGSRGRLSPARKGVDRAWNSSVDIVSSELPLPDRFDNSTMTDRDHNAATPTVNDSSWDEKNRLRPGESSKRVRDVDPVTLGRSRSDSAAVLVDSKSGDLNMSAIARSAGASPQNAPGIERLTQTSGAVLREWKKGPSSWKPPTSRAISASKSAPSNLHNLAVHLEKVSNNGTRAFSVDKQEAHPNTPIGPSSTGSPTGSFIKSRIILADGDPPNGQLPTNSVIALVDAIQNIVGAARESNQDQGPSLDESVNDAFYKIRDLDSGKEFLINELGTDKDPKLRELDTGKELTLEEFESSLGLSPVMQEVRRREREQDILDDDEVAQGHDSTASSKKKKKSLWVRTMKGVAKSVGAGSRTKSLQDPSKAQIEGSRGQTGGEDREGSVGKDSRREGSVDKSRRGQCVGAQRVSDDPPESLRPRSPQPVKVQVYKKIYKDLSDLNMGQEIQAHQGAIWTMKFSLDGRYLASAGQDRVVHVREVLDYPFAKDQGARDGLESIRGEDRAGSATPERSQHSQEGSLGRRASLRGSVGKRKSAKRSSSTKLPKLFWLSETAIHSFKGHTEDVLDLSWSRTQFLLSSSMDKTVRLWHISYSECLRVFTHNDFVTSIEFSPTDDRYFLSGSLDAKVRLWSIPDHQVVDWSDVREMVTSASYSLDGTRAVIGTYKGTCRYYNTTGQKLQLEGQIDVRNAQSKKSRGKKITGLQFVPGDSNKVLITSNDSRVRVYDGLELNLKFKGLRNLNSQISASFNRSGEYIISASEDSRVYIWNSGLQEFRGSRKDKPQAYENFPSSHVSIAVPWPGMYPQALGDVAKEDQSELDTSSSRQSTNDGPLRLPLRCSPSSSTSSSRSTHSESGCTSESVGECKSEQSINLLTRNGSGRDIGDEEVTSRRSDTNGSFLGLYDKVGTLHGSFRESPLREDGTGRSRPSPSSPALSVSNDSPSLRLSSLKSPSPTFFADTNSPKSSATWPEEKLPPLQDSVKSQGGSWSASSPSQDILSTELSPEGSTAGDVSTVGSWGLVIVTASLSGEIRTFQNYGSPIRL